jgi:uncharacterized membrane protein
VLYVATATSIVQYKSTSCKYKEWYLYNTKCIGTVQVPRLLLRRVLLANTVLQVVANIVLVIHSSMIPFSLGARYIGYSVSDWLHVTP